MTPKRPFGGDSGRRPNLGRLAGVVDTDKPGEVLAAPMEALAAAERLAGRMRKLYEDPPPIIMVVTLGL